MRRFSWYPLATRGLLSGIHLNGGSPLDRATRGKPRARPRDRWGILVGLVCFLVVVILVRGAGAQSVQDVCGRVVDEASGLPVARATVHLQHTGWRAQTDSDGRFCFEQVPEADYRVVVEAAGFDCPAAFEVRVHSDVMPDLLLPLSPRSYPLPGIRVVDTAVAGVGREFRVIGRERIREIQARDLSEILADAGGLYVTRTGGAGGQARATLRGSASKQVLVLIDGHRVNTASDGEFDPGSIPAEMIERVEIYTSAAAAEFGPDALAGAVNVITRLARLADPPQMEWSGAAGDWGTSRVAASVSNPLDGERFDVRGSYVRRQTRGDYPFAYTVDDGAMVHTGRRVNNYAEASNWFVSGRWLASRRVSVDFTGQAYESENGLPGRAVDQDSASFRTDERLILGLSGRCHVGSGAEVTMRAGWTSLKQHFEDPSDANPFTGLNSDYTDDVFSAGVVLDGKLWPGQTVRTGIDLQQDHLEHVDNLRAAGSLGRTKRSDVGLFVKSEQIIRTGGSRVVERVIVKPSVRFDRYRSDADKAATADGSNWSPHIAVEAVSRGGDWLSVAGEVAYGRSFRLPSTNALFWQGDARARGNPDLVPERAEQSEAGLRVHLAPDGWPLRFEGGVTYYHRYTRDIIVWVQGYGGVWQPVNLAAERATGHEDYARVALFGRLITIGYQNTVTDSKSRMPGHTTYGKALPFVPAFVQQVSLRMEHRHAFASVTSRHVGKRWATQANTRYFDSYRVTDLALGAHLQPIDWLRCTLEYRASNIENEHYVLISHYPMPGREWTVGLTLTIAMEDEDD